MEDIRCALVTGGTGLLGINIVKELIQHTSENILLLVRNLTEDKRRKFFHDLYDACQAGNSDRGQ